MTENRILALATRIKEETEINKLNWVKSSSANAYRLSLGSGMILLDYHPAGFEPAYYQFTVHNDRNTPIDSLVAYDNENDKDNFHLLENIYNLAENFFLKIDETYQSMFNALDLPF